MDPLSDVLSLLRPRIHGADGLDFGGEWAIQFPPHRGIKCYAILLGECMLSVDGIGDPLPLKAGDCFLLPQGRPFRLASDLNVVPILSTDCPSQGVIYQFGGGGSCFLAAGHFFLLNDHAPMLLGGLPAIVHMREESHKTVLRMALEGMRGELRPPDVTPVFHPAATRDRPLLSRRSACEPTGGFKPARCFSSSAANAAGVA